MKFKVKRTSNPDAADAYVGADREITLDMSRRVLAIHDGVTPGGAVHLGTEVYNDQVTTAILADETVPAADVNALYLPFQAKAGHSVEVAVAHATNDSLYGTKVHPVSKSDGVELHLVEVEGTSSLPNQYRVKSRLVKGLSVGDWSAAVNVVKDASAGYPKTILSRPSLNPDWYPLAGGAMEDGRPVFVLATRDASAEVIIYYPDTDSVVYTGHLLSTYGLTAILVDNYSHIDRGVWFFREYGTPASNGFLAISSNIFVPQDTSNASWVGHEQPLDLFVLPALAANQNAVYLRKRSDLSQPFTQYPSQGTRIDYGPHLEGTHFITPTMATKIIEVTSQHVILMGFSTSGRVFAVKIDVATETIVDSNVSEEVWAPATGSIAMRNGGISGMNALGRSCLVQDNTTAKKSLVKLGSDFFNDGRFETMELSGFGWGSWSLFEDVMVFANSNVLSLADTLPQTLPTSSRLSDFGSTLLSQNVLPQRISYANGKVYGWEVIATEDPNYNQYELVSWDCSDLLPE